MERKTNFWKGKPDFGKENHTLEGNFEGKTIRGRGKTYFEGTTILWRGKSYFKRENQTLEGKARFWNGKPDFGGENQTLHGKTRLWGVKPDFGWETRHARGKPDRPPGQVHFAQTANNGVSCVFYWATNKTVLHQNARKIVLLVLW